VVVIVVVVVVVVVVAAAAAAAAAEVVVIVVVVVVVVAHNVMLTFIAAHTKAGALQVPSLSRPELSTNTNKVPLISSSSPPPIPKVLTQQAVASTISDYHYLLQHFLLFSLRFPPLISPCVPP